jgi:hypothetical protein
MSTNAEAANVDAVARDEYESHPNTYQNKCPKGRTNRVPRYGGIAIFSILTPPAGEVRNHTKRAHSGSLPFANISNIDIHRIEANTYLQDAR